MSGSFKWSKETTLLIIDEYKLRKDKFRDPKIKKKDLWLEIQNQFQQRGYDVTIDLLDRKFRNLKKTFTDLKNKHSRTGNGRTSWEYFEIFNEIYTDEIAINSNITISSIDEEREERDDVLDIAQSSISLEQTGNRKRALKDYRQQQLDIEKAKLAKMDQLLINIEKNTRVHEQRNNLLQQIIDLSSNSSMHNFD